LCNEEGVLQTLVRDYGNIRESADANTHDSGSSSETSTETKVEAIDERATDPDDAKDEQKTSGAVTAEEDREKGEISWRIYGVYLKAMGGFFFAAMIGIVLILVEAATVANSLWLGYWSASEIKGFNQGQYMAVYGGEWLQWSRGGIGGPARTRITNFQVSVWL
jgi:ATP-binding cassette subfamily C (CFTR/MRP) protein 1